MCFTYSKGLKLSLDFTHMNTTGRTEAISCILVTTEALADVPRSEQSLDRVEEKENGRFMC